MLFCNDTKCLLWALDLPKDLDVLEIYGLNKCFFSVYESYDN